MGHFPTFKDIRAWHEGKKLSEAIENICLRSNVKYDSNFVQQTCSAARSVSANISEGNEASTVPDFIRFLSYAKRSAAEVESHLYDGLHRKYINQKEFDELTDLADKIVKMIAKLSHYLKRNNKRRL